MNWQKLTAFIDDSLTTLTTLWSSEKIHTEIEAAKTAAAADATAKADTVQTGLAAHVTDKDNPHAVTVAQIGAETPAGAQAKADAAKTAAISAAATDATDKADAVQGNLNTHTANVTDAHDVANRLQAVRAFLLNYCDQSIAALVNGAPEALDTLYELSNALGNDPNFSATVLEQIGQKATKATTLAGYGITDAAPAGFGLGTLGTVITDCNAITLSGFYAVPDSATNKPTSYSGSLLHITGMSTGHATQVFGYGAGNTFYMRVKMSGNWQPWKQIATTGSPVFTGVITADGYKFPATQVSSTDPNTIDDYEEGTFTPVIIGTATAGTGTYELQDGRYTKIGNRVDFSTTVRLLNHTGTGGILITGLPFVAAGGHSTPCAVFSSDLNFDSQLSAVVNVNSNSIQLYNMPFNAVFRAVPIDTYCKIWVNGTYFTN